MAPTFDATFVFVIEALQGKRDKSGKYLHDHCYRVATWHLGPLADDETRLVALLHDVVEDSRYTLDDLRAFGYSEAVVEAVGLLTFNEKTHTYDEYLRQIVSSGNKMALDVKLADNADNSNPERLATLPDDLRDKFATKYRLARETLLGLPPLVSTPMFEGDTSEDIIEQIAKDDDDWDGIDCYCGGGDKIGHASGCPAAERADLL